MGGIMISAEGTGKNIEKAIENALFELKASREDVDIKIINEGGLFKKAKVLVTISEDALPKYQKIDEIKKSASEEKQTKIKTKAKDVEIKKENTVQKQQVGLAETATKKRKATGEPKEDAKTETNVEIVASVKEIEQGKVVDPKEFLEGFFKVLGKEVAIDDQEDEKYRHISVDGDDMGEIIGHRGEGYYAINRLLSIMNGKDNKKILLDIGSFREKRAQSLTELAKRTANKVAKTGRYMKLNPMTPAERRVIHTALAEDERVTTLSKGTEPHRYVIIFPKGEE